MKVSALPITIAHALGIPPTGPKENERAWRTSSAFRASSFDPTSDFRAKRGPGGGADATPVHAAKLLISEMISVPRRDVVECAWMAYHLESSGSDEDSLWEDDEEKEKRGDGWQYCPVTQALMFGDALAACFEPDYAQYVEEVQLSFIAKGIGDWAMIKWSDLYKTSWFGSRKHSFERRFEHIARVDGLAIRMIARTLQPEPAFTTDPQEIRRHLRAANRTAQD